jgi:chromosome segregation ATPase
MTPGTDWTAQLDELQDKVERLALRHAEARRTQALLQQRVQQLEAERDSLRQRLGEARGRVDQLIARLQGLQDESADGGAAEQAR